MPTLVTEFGVPSSIGSAHNGPLGRDQGDHSEREAMRIDAELLRLIQDQGLAGGFLFGWADEWFKFTWNTIDAPGPASAASSGTTRSPTSSTSACWRWTRPGRRTRRRRTCSTPTAAGRRGGPRPGSTSRTCTCGSGWATRRRAPLTLGFDVLPGLVGTPPPGAPDRWPTRRSRSNLTDRTGQAYLRDQLDPVPLDYPVPAAARGPAPAGWQQFELVVNRELTVPSTGERLPAEILDVGRAALRQLGSGGRGRGQPGAVAARR